MLFVIRFLVQSILLFILGSLGTQFLHANHTNFLYISQFYVQDPRDVILARFAKFL